MRRVLLTSTLLAVPVAAWAQAVYVSPSGSDSNNGSAGAPFRTIAAAAAAATPGTIVNVAPGDYAGGFTTSASGTTAAPITFVSTVPGAAHIVNGGAASDAMAWKNTGNNAVVQGFNIDGTGAPSWRLGFYNSGSNVKFQNNTVHDILTDPGAFAAASSSGNGGAGIEMDGAGGGSSASVTGNTVYNIGPSGTQSALVHGIYEIASGTVSNNAVSNVVGNGVTSWHSSHNIQITGNTIAGARDGGIFVGSGDSGATSTSGDYFTVADNTVTGSAWGIAEGGTTGAHNTYTGNLLYNNAQNTISLQNGLQATDTTAAGPNSVAQASSAGPQDEIVPGGPSLTDAQGNVWLITQSGSIQKNGEWVPGGGGTAALTIQNGVVYGKDDSGKGWFDLSSDGQYWTPSTAPPRINPLPVLNPVGVNQPPGGTTNVSLPPANNGPPQGGTTLPLSPVTPKPCDLASSGQFAAIGNTIYGPNQEPFSVHGINIMEGNAPTVAQVTAAFPGVNFIRYAIYDFAPPATLAAYIQQFTDHGIVVELEDHTNSDGSNAGGQSGTVFTGQQLSNELAWYSSIASAFKGNPYVWFGTNNEPATTPSVAALSNWQKQTYDAIRSAGNNAPVMLETILSTNNMAAVNQGMVPADYAGMSNTIWDMHYYGWVVNMSTSQATIDQSIAEGAAAAQKITNASGTMPVVVAEYGNSTTGQSIDPNGAQVVAGVNTSGLGSAAWAWGSGNPGDGLTNGSTPTSPYGQQVAGYINSFSPNGASGTPSMAVACAANPNATAPTTMATARASPTPQNSLSSIPAPAGAN